MTKVQEFFDPATYTLTYVVWDPTSRDAVVIDPVWDYDPAASKFTTKSSDRLIEFLKQSELNIHFILETHAHADHVSAAQLVKQAFPKAVIAVGERIQAVQQTFAPIFGFGPEFPVDGKQFDRLLKQNELVKAGTLELRTLFTPGHTPACSSYLFGDKVFTGDALFMPDYGTGRCDFPRGDAETLFESISSQLYTLPDSTVAYTGHDYQPGGRALAFSATIAEHKRINIHLSGTTTKEKFVTFRKERDKTLQAPRLLLPSVQINIDAGRLPAAHKNGKRYLSIPLFE